MCTGVGAGTRSGVRGQFTFGVIGWQSEQGRYSPESKLSPASQLFSVRIRTELSIQIQIRATSSSYFHMRQHRSDNWILYKLQVLLRNIRSPSEHHS